MTVSAVVISWNARELTLRCLDSLARATYPQLDVIVVDNHSHDETAAAVAERHPTVEVLLLDTNRGFAGGVNAGLERARATGADHVFLLNNDATIDPDAIEPLVAAAADASVGAVCSQILHEGAETIWYAGATYDPRRGHQGRHSGYGKPPLPKDTPPYPTDRACGGAMLVSRAALDRVGGLDEALFAYAEDVDWSLRARAVGLELLVAPGSVVRHRVSASSGGASSPGSVYYALRNGLVVAERAAPLGRLGTARRRAEAVSAFGVQALLSEAPLRGVRAVLAGFMDAHRRRLGQREL